MPEDYPPKETSQKDKTSLLSANLMAYASIVHIKFFDLSEPTMVHMSKNALRCPRMRSKVGRYSLNPVPPGVAQG